MKKLILLGIATTMILALLITGCIGDDNGKKEEEEPEPAPDFTLTSLDGDTFDLNDFRGKVVILDFMFANCTYCDDEMEELNKVYSNYDDNEVVIITIDIREDDTEDDLRWFKDEYGDDWIYAMDTDDVKTKYNVGPVPMIVIVDKEGNIAYDHVGVVDYGTLSSKIDELL